MIRCNQEVRSGPGRGHLCDDEPGHAGACWSKLYRTALDVQAPPDALGGPLVPGIAEAMVPIEQVVAMAAAGELLELEVPGVPGHTVRGRPENVRRYVAERERALVERTEWPGENHQQMTALARLFPSFARHHQVPGIDPWDAAKLVHWLNTSGQPTSGSRHAALFLLSVWNRDDWTVHGLRVRRLKKGDWKGSRRIGRFDMNDAWAVWDREHRAAALAWLLNPFWP